MPDIDTLSIRIESSVEKALPAFNKLIESLTSLNSSLTRSGTAFGMFTTSIKGAASSMRELNSHINSLDITSIEAKLRTLQRIDLSNLNKTLNFDINLNGSEVAKTEEAYRLAYDKLKTLAEQTANDIVNEFHIADQKVAQDLKNNLLSFAQTGEGLYSNKGRLQDRIVESFSFTNEEAAAMKSGMSSLVDGMEAEWQRFIDEFRRKKILYQQDVRDMAQASESVGRIAGTKNMMGELTGFVSSKGQINLENMETIRNLAADFPNILSETELKAADIAGRFDIIREKILQAKDALARNNIDTNDSALVSAAIDSYYGKLGQLEAQTRNVVQTIKNGIANDKIILDIGINEEKLAADIQAAIERSVTARTKPIVLDAKIDASKIRQAIVDQFKGIDITTISGIAEALKQLNISASNLANLQGLNLTNVSRQLTKLSTIDTAKIMALSQTLGAFVTSLPTAMPDLPTFTAGMESVLTAVSRFSRKSVEGAIQNLPNLGAAIASMLTSLANAPQVSQSNVAALTAISNINFPAINRASKSGASESTKKLSSSVRNLNSSIGASSGNVLNFFKSIGSNAANAIARTARFVTDLSHRFIPFGKSASKARLSLSGLISKIMSLYMKIFFLRRIISGITTAITKSMNYVESYHFFQVSMDKIGKEAKDSFAEYGEESAEAYMDSFRTRALQLNEKMSGYAFDANGNAFATGNKSLGLDSDQLLQYQAQYAQMANSIGMTGEAALATSKALTMLAGDWSSLRNIDFSTAYEKMASALAGQSRAVRSLGIDITQAALAETAANIGLTTSVQKMGQAEKAMLRMITMIQQSKVAWGDLATTLNTPANQMRMLKQSMQALARTIGNLFLPVVAKVLPYINGLVMALQRLFQWIARLLGIKVSDSVSSMGGLNDSLGDLGEELDNDLGSEPVDDLGDAADDLGDAFDDANESAKELKRTILAFDELNVLNSPDLGSSTGSGSSPGKTGTGSDGTGGIGLSPDEMELLDNALLDALDEYEKAWNAAFEAMASKAHEFAQKLEEIGKIIYDFIHNKAWEDLGSYLAGIVNSGIDWLIEHVNWEKIRSMIIPAIEGLAMTLNGLVSDIHWEDLGRWIGGGVNTLFDAMYTWFTTFDFGQLGQRLMDGLMAMVAEIEWYHIGEALAAKFMAAWRFFGGLVESWDPSLSGASLAKLFNGWISQVSFVDIGRSIADLFNKSFEWLGSFLENFDPDNQLGTKFGNGINTFISRVNPIEIADSINGLFKKAVDEIKAADINWGELGRKVAQFIGELDWPVFLSETTQILIDAFGGFFSGILSQALGGFGENFADGFVKGVKAVIGLDEKLILGVSKALEKLAEVLNMLPPEVVEKLGTALGVFFGIKVTAALGTQILGVATGLFGLNKVIGGTAGMTLATNCSTLATNIGNLLSTLSVYSGAGIMAGAITGAVELAAKIQSIVEKSKGLNGVLSEIGTAAQDTLDKMREAGTITGEQHDELLKVIDDCENAEMSMDDTSKALVDKLTEYGVSTKEFQQNVASSTNHSIDAVSSLKTASEELGEGFASMASGIDVSNTTAADSVSAMRSTIYNAFQSMRTEGSTFADLYEQYMNDFDNSVKGASTNGQDALDKFITALRNNWAVADEDITALTETIKTQLPGAVDATTGSLKDLGDKAEEAKSKADPLNTILDAMTADMTWSDSIKTLLVVGALKTLAENSGDADGKISSLSDNMNFLADKTSFQENVEGLSTALQSAGVDTDAFYGALVEAIQNSESAVPEGIASVISELEGSQESLKTSAKTSFAYVGEGGKEGIDESIPIVKESMENLAQDGVVEPFENALNMHSPSKVMHDKAKLAGDGIAGGLDDSTPTVKKSSSGLAESLIKAFEEKLKISGSNSEWAKSTGRIIPSGIGEGIDNTKPALLDNVGKMASEIVSKFDTIKEDTARKFDGFGQRITETIGDLSPIGYNSMSAIAQGVSNGTNEIYNAMTGILNAMTSPFNDIWNIGYNIGASLSNAISAGIASNHISIPHITYVGSNSVTYDGGTIYYPLFDLQWYAKGGLFTKPTLAGFGEAGYEAALPLTNKSVMKQIARAITESGGYGGFDHDDMVEAVATGVAMAMAQNPQTVEVLVHSILKTNDETLAQAVDRGRARLDMRYNATAAYGY